jgi:hypothetical protein
MCNGYINIYFVWLSIGSPRVDGDEDEEDVDDIDNEFSYRQGAGKNVNQHWQPGDADLSSSSRHHRIPRLTGGQQVLAKLLSFQCVFLVIPFLF